MVCIKAGTKKKDKVTVNLQAGDKIGSLTAPSTGANTMVDSAGAAVTYYAMAGCGKQGASMLVASVMAASSLTYSLL